MTRARIITDFAELEALVPSWRDLLGRATHPEPVLTPLWLLTWWREFGAADRRTLSTVVVEDGGRMVGLVPLARRLTAHRPGIPVRRIELLATGEDEADEICSDYVGALVAPGFEGQVARATAAALHEGAIDDWDELRMPAMNGEDPFVARLAEELRERVRDASVDASGECPYVPLPGSWEAYLHALGSDSRYVVARSLRELEKWAGKGGWELRVARTEGELAEGMRILRDLHAGRWAAEGHAGVFASVRFTRFHETVMPRLLAGEDGAQLELSWLLARGSAVAASYSIVFRGKVYFYQSGRRVDVPRMLRPGIALHALGIRASIEAGRREYDFLAGASRYKRDLAPVVRPLVTLRAVGTGLRARAVEVARGAAERAIERLRAVRRKSARPGEERARE
jgi:CelD/BcsL family acetyltransferase involved in cellulose biosynthesis